MIFLRPQALPHKQRNSMLSRSQKFPNKIQLNKAMKAVKILFDLSKEPTKTTETN